VEKAVGSNPAAPTIFDIYWAREPCRQCLQGSLFFAEIRLIKGEFVEEFREPESRESQRLPC